MMNKDAKLTLIFGAFFTLVSTLICLFLNESVGIGLALAKTVLEKEKGDIIVNSELGKGSIFELRFYKTIV